jgi:transketolase
MGDGELAEGSNGRQWRQALQVDNLTAIIDRNGLQIIGKPEDDGDGVLRAKFEASVGM